MIWELSTEGLGEHCQLGCRRVTSIYNEEKYRESCSDKKSVTNTYLE